MQTGKNKTRIKARRAKQAKALFKRSVMNKRGSHWSLCLASFYVVGLRDGSTEFLAESNDSVSVDSIEDYARTYRLYQAIRRRYARVRCVMSERRPAMAAKYQKDYQQVVRDLRDLRKELHYTKWLIVANAVFTGFKEKNGRRYLTLPQALDALKSGADGSTEMFAAYVAGAEISQSKAFRQARKALFKVLSYPMSKKDRRIFKSAYKNLERKVSKND